MRRGRSTDDLILAVANFTPVPREGYRVGVPRGGRWRELLNSDAASYGGAKGRDRVPELVDLYMAGDLDLESLVSLRISLNEVNDAFEAMERQDGIRTVITY